MMLNKSQKFQDIATIPVDRMRGNTTFVFQPTHPIAQDRRQPRVFEYKGVRLGGVS
jgi:hypothetical protein